MPPLVRAADRRGVTIFKLQRTAGSSNMANYAAERCVKEWRRRARSRRELLMLSEYELQDMSWTRGDAMMEASKPFWQQ